MSGSTLSADTLAVLSDCTVQENTVILPARQLGRDAYIAVDKALRGLGGKWSRKAKGHVFPFDPSDALTEAVSGGEYVNRKQELQFFPTPDDLAARLVQHGMIEPGMKVLEPSAGQGAIVRNALNAGAHVTAVEVDAAHCAMLSVIGAATLDVVHADFPAWAAANKATAFDAVLMNPPFRRNQDAKHIQAAWALLKPSGRLVAICSEGVLQRSRSTERAFQQWVADIGASLDILPPGTFKAAGTSVSTVLLRATTPF